MVGKAIRGNLTQIEAEIAAAEAKTSGEIVVVFARQAGHYEREHGLIAFGFSIAVFLASWIGMPTLQPSMEGALISWLVVSLLGGYALGLLVSHFVPEVPMLLVRKKRRLHMAEDRAAIAFHDLHVANTRAHTGILILIAELERVVVVLGDGPIAEKISSAEWQNVRDAIISGIRARKPDDGLCEGVRRAGEVLASHFPVGNQDRQELPNGVRFIR